MSKRKADSKINRRAERENARLAARKPARDAQTVAGAEPPATTIGRPSAARRPKK